MNEYSLGARNRSQKCRVPDGKIQCLLNGEEQLLQSISAHTPLPGLLNKICNALDCDIGNMVSFICLWDDDATDLPTIARNAKDFGLYTFCSACILGENDETLGSLEMYCCVPRSPSFDELQLVARAVCLAAIAIKRYTEAGNGGTPRIHRSWPVRRFVLQWSVPMN